MSAKQKDAGILESTETHTLPVNASGHLPVRDLSSSAQPASLHLKRKEMETALVPPSPRKSPKQKRQKHAGRLPAKEWRGVVDKGTLTSLEGQFFKYRDCIGDDAEVLVFKDCEFLTDLDVFKKGDRVPEVEIYMESSVMRVYTDNDDSDDDECPHVDFYTHLVLQRID